MVVLLTLLCSPLRLGLLKVGLAARFLLLVLAALARTAQVMRALGRMAALAAFKPTVVSLQPHLTAMVSVAVRSCMLLLAAWAVAVVGTTVVALAVRQRLAAAVAAVLATHMLTRPLFSSVLVWVLAPLLRTMAMMALRWCTKRRSRHTPRQRRARTR